MHPAIPAKCPKKALLCLLLLNLVSCAFSSLSPGIPGSWDNVTDQITGVPVERHEACFVMHRGKGYLIGGRGKNNPVDIFDPETRTWTTGPTMIETMHHTQCVAHKGTIYIPSAWYGPSRFEIAHEVMWVFHTGNLTWGSLPGLPPDRQRGAAACVLFDSKIWVVGGNQGGHGSHSVTLGMVDYYDLATRTWHTNLPELPEGRDHVGGAVVKSRLCIAGGRNGTVGFDGVIASTYCMNKRMVWSNMNADIPSLRAGAMTHRTCDGKMMVAGGEGPGYWGPPKRVTAAVEVFNGTGWEIYSPLTVPRHGSGLGTTRCSRCGHIFIASGSGSKGGRMELQTVDRYVPADREPTCSSY